MTSKNDHLMVCERCGKYYYSKDMHVVDPHKIDLSKIYTTEEYLVFVCKKCDKWFLENYKKIRKENLNDS